MSDQTWWEKLVEEVDPSPEPDPVPVSKRSDDEVKCLQNFAGVTQYPLVIPDDPNIIPTVEIEGRTFTVEYMEEGNKVLIGLVTEHLDNESNGFYLTPIDSPISFWKRDFVHQVRKLLGQERRNMERAEAQKRKAEEVAAFNAARHPYLTYEYLEEKDVSSVIAMGKLGFRVIATYMVRGAAEKEPRYLMERCSNNIQHKNPDGEETLPF